MDTFYNHLSAFSADSTPHCRSDVRNTKETTRLPFPPETTTEGDEWQATEQYMQGTYQ